MMAPAEPQPDHVQEEGTPTSSPGAMSEPIELPSLPSQQHKPSPKITKPIVLVSQSLTACILEDYAQEEFVELPLACRFVPTDQWLTTRLDASWTVRQAKVHILSKFLGRHSHPSNLSFYTPAYSSAGSSGSSSSTKNHPHQAPHPTSGAPVTPARIPKSSATSTTTSESFYSSVTPSTAIGASSSNAIDILSHKRPGSAAPDTAKSTTSSLSSGSMVFAFNPAAGDEYSYGYGYAESPVQPKDDVKSLDEALNPPEPEEEAEDEKPDRSNDRMSDIAVGGISAWSSAESLADSISFDPGEGSSFLMSPSSTSGGYNYGDSSGWSRVRTVMGRDTYGRDGRETKREEERRRWVEAKAKDYCLVSFSNGMVLEDIQPLDWYRLNPFELLELQRKNSYIHLPRTTYTDPYFDCTVWMRGRSKNKAKGKGPERETTSGASALGEKLSKRSKKVVKDLKGKGREDTSEKAQEATVEHGSATKADHSTKRRERILSKESYPFRGSHPSRSDRERDKELEKESETWKRRWVTIRQGKLQIWKRVKESNPLGQRSSSTQLTKAGEPWDLSNLISVGSSVSGPPPSLPTPHPSPDDMNHTGYSVTLRFTRPPTPDSENARTSLQSESNPLPAPQEKGKNSKHDRNIHSPLSGATIPLFGRSTIKELEGEMQRKRLKHREREQDAEYVEEHEEWDGKPLVTLLLRLSDPWVHENLLRTLYRYTHHPPTCPDVESSDTNARAHAQVLSLLPTPTSTPFSIASTASSTTLPPTPASPGGRIHGRSSSGASSKLDRSPLKYPGWREEVLRRAVIVGRGGILTSPAWGAALEIAEAERRREERQLARDEYGELRESDGETESDDDDRYSSSTGIRDRWERARDQDETLHHSEAEWEDWTSELSLSQTWVTSPPPSTARFSLSSTPHQPPRGLTRNGSTASLSRRARGQPSALSVVSSHSRARSHSLITEATTSTEMSSPLHSYPSPLTSFSPTHNTASNPRRVQTASSAIPRSRSSTVSSLRPSLSPMTSSFGLGITNSSRSRSFTAPDQEIAQEQANDNFPMPGRTQIIKTVISAGSAGASGKKRLLKSADGSSKKDGKGKPMLHLNLSFLGASAGNTDVRIPMG